MAIDNVFQSAGAILGFNPFETYTTREFALGTRINGVVWSDTKDRNTDFVYVKNVSANSLARGYVAELPVNSGTDSYQVDTLITTAIVGALTAVGDIITLCVPQVDIPAGEFGWVAVRGTMTVRINGAATAGDSLFTTATAGAVDDDASSTHKIFDLVPQSSPGSASLIECFTPTDLYSRRAA